MASCWSLAAPALPIPRRIFSPTHASASCSSAVAWRRRWRNALFVMPGLVPGIHDSLLRNTKDVDGRDKPGHDGKRLTRSDGDCRSGPFQPARGWKGGGRADRALKLLSEPPLGPVLPISRALGAPGSRDSQKISSAETSAT